jgi:hypothetical protein
MRDRDVHAVGIIVGDVLPIDLARPQRHATLRNELLHPVRGELFRIRRRHLAHARRAGLEAHEHEAHEDFLLQRDQSAVLHVETAERGSLRDADQLAFERVAPVVIRTLDELTAVALLSVEQARGPMPADVVEAAQLTILAADRNDRLVEQIEAVIVADLGNVVAVADQLPAGAEDRALLQLEEIRVVVDPPGQTKIVLVRESRPGGLDRGAHSH